MAAGSPARAHLQKRAVRHLADVDFARRYSRALHLRMTAKAKIRIVLHQHFAVGGTVRRMADGAALAHGFVFENERLRLLEMTLRAALVHSRHGESAGRFEDVAAVRIVTLNATHFAFDHGMMLRQAEFRADFQMALETGRGILAGIDDEMRAAAGRDVFAAGPMTGFATVLALHSGIFKMNARVRTGGKFPDDFRVAIGAGFVADVMRAGNLQWGNHGAGQRRAGIHQRRRQTNGQPGGDQRHALQRTAQSTISSAVLSHPLGESGNGERRFPTRGHSGHGK